jgi:hypothetical protein
VGGFSEYANRRGAKSLLSTLLALLALLHIGTSLHVGLRECEADLGKDSAFLMPKIRTKSPFVACGAESKEAHLYGRLQDVVRSDAAWLRL